MTRQISRRSFIGIGASLLAASTGYRVAAAQDFVTPAAIGLQDAYTFLVMGMDTRPNGSELNTDVLMLSRVNLVDYTVRTISIPRDLYVDIPGVGPNKINAAFKSSAENGEEDWMQGMASTRATMEYNFGVTIDATLSVRFEGVEAIVDALGGITFENPYDLRDEGFGDLDYPAGTHQVNGKETLQLMRSRNQDSDDGRVMRQQILLSAMLDKVREPATLVKLPELVKISHEYVITDIPFDVQLQLVAAVPMISRENLYWGTISQLLWSDTTTSGMWVYQGDWNQLPGYVQSFLNGEI